MRNTPPTTVRAATRLRPSTSRPRHQAHRPPRSLRAPPFAAHAGIRAVQAVVRHCVVGDEGARVAEDVLPCALAALRGEHTVARRLVAIETGRSVGVERIIRPRPRLRVVQRHRAALRIVRG
eukprot:5178216-Prymnesium_polylepis.1